MEERNRVAIMSLTDSQVKELSRMARAAGFCSVGAMFEAFALDLLEVSGTGDKQAGQWYNVTLQGAREREMIPFTQWAADNDYLSDFYRALEGLEGAEEAGRDTKQYTRDLEGLRDEYVIETGGAYNLPEILHEGYDMRHFLADHNRTDI